VSYLIDTNVLLRFFDLTDPQNGEIVRALDAVTRASEETFVCAQVLIEYWAVATRPREANGLGLDIAEADQNLDEIEALFACLPEPPDMAERWRAVVTQHSVSGKQAHDARLAALMQAHGVVHLVTLNPQDFARYQDITPLTPAEALSL